MNSTLSKALRMCAAWAVLGAIIACGGSDEDAEQAAEELAAALAPVEPTQAQPTAAPPGTSAVTVAAGFMPDPQKARGVLSDGAAASSLGSNASACVGTVPTAPQHEVTLAASFSNLRIMVSSDADTTLVIRRPDGTFACADDDEGLNPIVEGEFPAGTYQIYVGHWGATPNTPYVLGFSELPHVTTADLGT